MVLLFMHFVSGAACVGVAGFLMMRFFRLSKVVTEPNLLSVFFVSFIAMHVVPAAFFLVDEIYVAAAKYYWGAVLSALLIPLGGVASKTIAGGGQRVLAFMEAPIANDASDMNALRIFFVVLVIVCAIVTFSYIQNVPHYTLKALLLSLNTTDVINQMRVESEIGYLYGVFLFYFMPFCFVLAVLIVKFDRKATLLRLLAVLAIVMVVFYNSYSSRKTPIAMLFVLWAIVEAVVGAFRNRNTSNVHRTKQRSHRNKIIIITALTIAVAYPVFIFKHKAFGADRSIAQIVWVGVVQRILIKPALNTYYAFEVFPDRAPFTEFDDVAMVASLKGEDVVRINTLIAAYKGQDSITNAPPTTIGRLYAEGGFIALILGVFIIAALFQFVQIFFLRAVSRKTVWSVAVFTILVWSAFRVNMGAAHTVLLSEVGGPLILSGGIYYVCKKVTRRKRSAGLSNHICGPERDLKPGESAGSG